MDYSKHQFERLFKENYQIMYRVAYSIVENEDDAKDAVSQVFSEIWHKKPQVKKGAETGYLLAATKNQCLHVVQKKKHRQAAANDPFFRAEMYQDAEHQELMMELNRVIENSLTEKDRQILSLHYYDDLTYAETAEELGISSSAVNKHITHSLSKIRTILQISK